MPSWPPLRERQSIAQKKVQQAEKDLQLGRQELEFIQKTLDALRPLDGLYSSVAAMSPPLPQRAERGHNRKTIVEILIDHGSPMKTAEIARTAHEQEKIKSTKGFDGVYGTVSTVLSLDNGRLFVNADGKWDLKDRLTTDRGSRVFSRMITRHRNTFDMKPDANLASKDDPIGINPPFSRMPLGKLETR